jgi:hypothetical protein
VGEGVEGSGGTATLPSPPNGHDFYMLSTLTRNPNEAAISSDNITDERFKGLNLEEISRFGDLSVSKFKNVFVTGIIGIRTSEPGIALNVPKADADAVIRYKP